MADVEIREIGRPGDLGWIVAAHGELYAAEFGWDASFEALVARIVADFTPGPRERGWIAELDGHRVGCVLCVPGADPDTAVLRILLVHPDARGHGLGRRLVATCVGFAREHGYATLRLWTNDVLAAARHLYLDAGFRLVAEEPHHSFGADLTGQDYALSLGVNDHDPVVT
ncbi:GNAT family N-acetyltransferase [Pseudonocardia sp. RS11V-5]|uniref:GNAT family N-acetyltransferase n=1 Tax=Pseudonocardia terrae TaxID=2905831 RepID=UPI001E644BBA|nr:GNAT family N-acetyltransferase [Pseudonocardia terrae]MCE3552317.1 GNAT family N-acetyltransferase [Pseudonocardia terrae]